MAGLAPVSVDELVRRLRRLGFLRPYAEGKHRFVAKGELRLTIPNPIKDLASQDPQDPLQRGQNVALQDPRAAMALGTGEAKR